MGETALAETRCWTTRSSGSTTTTFSTSRRAGVGRPADGTGRPRLYCQRRPRLRSSGRSPDGFIYLGNRTGCHSMTPAPTRRLRGAILPLEPPSPKSPFRPVQFRPRRPTVVLRLAGFDLGAAKRTAGRPCCGGGRPAARPRRLAASSRQAALRVVHVQPDVKTNSSPQPDPNLGFHEEVARRARLGSTDRRVACRT